MSKVNDHILSGDEDKKKVNEVSYNLLTRYMKGSQADIECRLKNAHKNAETIEDKEKITDKKRSRLAGQMTALEKITSADRERRLREEMKVNENTTNRLKVGDVVKIRGDKRINNNGQCAYTDDQLIDGKYVKHAHQNKAWSGEISKINDAKSLALVGGGWRHFDSYEKA